MKRKSIRTILQEQEAEAIQVTEATHEANNSLTVEPQNGTSEPVQQNEQDEDKATEKLTLYLFPRQSDKLDELIMQYKKHTGKRIQRNKLMRRLIDQATLETLLEEAVH